MAELSRRLRVGQERFGFAGTKDKRGVTSQLMTLFKVCCAMISYDVIPAMVCECDLID